MGNLQSIPDAHIRIYKNLLSIQDIQTRIQMIHTLLASPEHRASSVKAGIYGQIMQYIQTVEGGGRGVLPGEGVSGGGSTRQELVQRKEEQRVTIASDKGNEKAINYFSACLRILELEEEVALTQETLKAAYKKAVIRAHPDKGGSEKEFEAVTRAYAYLGDILRRILGGRTVEGKVEAPTALSSTRSKEAESWKHIEPVRLNPNKLDMNMFNRMFEETRLPDPDDQGYGDWLKDTSEKGNGQKFSGKFNRDVFNKMFEEEARGGKGKQGASNALVVQEMSLASRMGYGVELGRSKTDDYTVAPHEGKVAYTDLKKAYTEYNTFSQETAGVKVDSRSIEEIRTERKAAPAPLRDYEREALLEAEARAKKAEELRKIRMAHEARQEEDHFARMQRLVIRDGAVKQEQRYPALR